MEIAVAAAIIGVLAALAIPAYKRSQENAKIATIENDLRVYVQDFETFELEYNSLPPSQPIAGQFPEGMDDRMPANWKLPTPIGGTYRWVYTTESKPSQRSAYIEIFNDPDHPIRLSLKRLEDIDDDLDDGNLASGQFILSGMNIRYYIRR